MNRRSSPQHLRLLLVRNEKTPVKESLDIWPPLPIMLDHYLGNIDNHKNFIAMLDSAGDATIA